MAQGQRLSLRHLGFWAISLTLAMVAYNVSVLPAIMPRVVLDLDTSIGYIQSILIVFSLVTASFAATTENLCRFYGRTPVFSTGLVLYGIGIAATSLSPTIGWFALSFSLLTGLAATPLISTPWAIADLVYDEESSELATLGLILASVLGGLMGVLLGGFIASRISWRWAFLPSLSLLLLVSLFRRSLPNLNLRSEQPIDWMGGLLSFLGLTAIFMGFSLGGEFGWWEPRRVVSIAGLVIPPFALSIVPTLVAVGVIILGFFGLWQRRQADRSKASLLRVGLLREQEFVFGILAAMVHTLITTGVQFNLYQFIPVALSLNPFETALTVIPYNLTIPVVLVAVVKYRVLSDRIAPKYIVLSGISLLGAGIAVLYSRLDWQVTSLELIPGLVIMGIGSGLFLSYVSALAFSAASAAEKPQCPGIYNPIQNLGSSLGRGILGTALMFFASQGIVDGILQRLDTTLSPAQRFEAISRLQEMLQTFSRQEIQEIFANKLPPSVYPLVRSISRDAATSGIKISLLIALVFIGICLLLATRLPKYPSCRRV